MSRKRQSVPQLDLLEAAPRRPDLDPTPPLARHGSCPRVLEMIRQVRIFFPELDGISIRVGLTRAAAGFAAKDEFMVWMNPRGLTRHTIAHELTHLLQNLDLVPKGEKSADLYALARHRTLVDEMPCYLKTPRAMTNEWPDRREEIEATLHRTAKEALVERENGRRRYLRWFEDVLAETWRPATVVAPIARGVQTALL